MVMNSTRYADQAIGRRPNVGLVFSRPEAGTSKRPKMSAPKMEQHGTSYCCRGLSHATPVLIHIRARTPLTWGQMLPRHTYRHHARVRPKRMTVSAQRLQLRYLRDTTTPALATEGQAARTSLDGRCRGRRGRRQKRRPVLLRSAPPFWKEGAKCYGLHGKRADRVCDGYTSQHYTINPASSRHTYRSPKSHPGLDG